MASRTKFEQIGKRVDQFYALCEKIALRTLLFVCFMVELARFVGWLFR
jgi:hypothetical protein